MKTVVACIGDYYHEYGLIKRSLDAALGGDKDIDVRYISEKELLSALAARPDTIVLFKEDRLNPNDEDGSRWMTPEYEAAIVGYVEQGGGFVGWHSGLASYDKEGRYYGMLRGYFLHHPWPHQDVTYTCEPGTSGLAGNMSYEVIDEHYFVQVDEANPDVFLRSKSIDGESIAAWAHRFGEGRVCCVTPAHREEGLLHPAFLELLRKSVRWCTYRGESSNPLK